MYYRIGRQLDEKRATAWPRRTIRAGPRLEPAHQPTLAALRTIAVDAADWDRASRYPSRAVVTESPRVRAKLLVELGKMREMLGEHDLAVQAYELALQATATTRMRPCRGAEYATRQEWARAEPLAEMLVRRAQARTASSTCCRTCSAVLFS